jgi:hypothetical protein
MSSRKPTAVSCVRSLRSSLPDSHEGWSGTPRLLLAERQAG